MVAGHVSDLVWGVGFTRSQNISQAKTTIKFDAVNLYPGPEVFLEIFLCERKKKQFSSRLVVAALRLAFSLAKNNFKKNLWNQVVNRIIAFPFV